jgi:hypothetical protein
MNCTIIYLKDSTVLPYSYGKNPAVFYSIAYIIMNLSCIFFRKHLPMLDKTCFNRTYGLNIALPNYLDEEQPHACFSWLKICFFLSTSVRKGLSRNGCRSKGIG